MEAFVYRWREKTTGKWYIGFHKGSPDDGYICSSKIVKPKIERDPKNWERKILRYGTKERMIALEKIILTKLNAKKNPNSYNLSNGFGSFKFHLSYDLDKMSAQEIAEKYNKEIQSGNWKNVLLIDCWIIKKFVADSNWSRVMRTSSKR